MNTYIVANKRYDVPSRWNELTQTQLLWLARVWSKETSPQRRAWLTLLILLQLWKSARLTWDWYLWLNHEDRANALILGEWLHSDDPSDSPQGEIHPHSPPQGGNLTECKVGRVKGLRCVVPVGSEDLLGHMVYRQLIACETAYVRYYHALRDKDTEAAKVELATLCGNLYTPDGQWSDKQEADYPKAAARIPMHYQSVILWWYEGCRKEWKPLHPHVYPTPKKGDEEKEPSRDDGGAGWLYVMRQQAGGPIQMAEMAYTAADVALYDLEQRLKEQKEKEERK
ncbi:MAG: hypothetical protein MJH10_11880 [Epibacterium sp.]|nr:hypothetical protein [Epibacterium sp.]NQX74246.1 hypothetical protein [Epibacterium sp.]